MKKYPSVYTLRSLLDHVAHNSAGINGKWVPARSVGYHSMMSRLRCAWMVFTGKGDVVIWPEGQ